MEFPRKNGHLECAPKPLALRKGFVTIPGSVVLNSLANGGDKNEQLHQISSLHRRLSLIHPELPVASLGAGLEALLQTSCISKILGINRLPL